MRVNIHELAAKEFYEARVKKDIKFFTTKSAKYAKILPIPKILFYI